MMTGLRHLLHAQRLFSLRDLGLFLVVLLVVTLLPVFLCAFRKRSTVAVVSTVVFVIYIIGNLSFTILNRETLSPDALVLRPGDDLRKAFYLDLGIAGTIRTLFRDGFRAAAESIHVRSSFMAREVFLNILLYLPLGYLLPFVFKSLRRHPLMITMIGALCSIATELAQLYFHIGYFQVDDILLNTIGTFIGAVFGCILAKIWRVE